jgi:hypothetical protein
MKPKYLNKAGEKVAIIKIEFKVTERLIRDAIINLLHMNMDSPSKKKDIIEEIKRITYNYGEYGYGEMIDPSEIDKYDEYEEIANQKIKKYFPEFI